MATRSSWTVPFITEKIVPNTESQSILAQSWGNSATADATANYASGYFGNTGFSTKDEILDFSTLYSEGGLTYLQEAGYDSGIDYSAFDLNKNFFERPSGGEGWTFVTTPGDISWSTDASVERLSVYGTNTAPVVVGSKGMRDLKLSDALVEGFSRLKTVESKITSLENLMNFTLNGGKGFVNVPVYQVWANSKKYGFGNGVDGGYFVIESVNISESMRDLDGNATRATVDISFKQVPAYQVDSGRDQASKSLTGAKNSQLLNVSNQVGQGVGAATGATKAGSGASGPARAGVGSTSSATQTAPASGFSGTPTLGRIRYTQPGP